MKDNLIRKLESFVKPALFVIAVLLLFFLAASRESRAEMMVEAGPTFLSGEFADGGALIVHEEWDRKWSVGFGYISTQQVEDRSERVYDLRPNLFVQGQRLAYLGNHFSIGVGIAYFNDTNRAMGSHFNAQLGLRYEFEKFYLAVRHWSNAGSATPNMGQDLIVVGYRF